MVAIKDEVISANKCPGNIAISKLVPSGTKLPGTLCL